MGGLRLAIVIPAWNEANTIAAVVEGVKPFGGVIVVDDASTDETAALAERAGALVVRNDRNLQYDGSLEAGLSEAARQGFEHALTMDADGQHDPADINNFSAALTQGADVVIGIRPKAARAAERLFSLVSRRLWGIQDPLCGMKAYRLSWLPRYESMTGHASIGTRLALAMARDGAVVRQFPIAIRPREDRPRFGGGVKANWRILKALFMNLIAGPRNISSSQE